MQINSVSNRKGKPRRRKQDCGDADGVGGRDWGASINKQRDSRRGAISLTDTLLLLSRKGRSIFTLCVLACARVSALKKTGTGPFFTQREASQRCQLFSQWLAFVIRTEPNRGSSLSHRRAFSHTEGSGEARIRLLKKHFDGDDRTEEFLLHSEQLLLKGI